jgi:hypothetical protein
LEKPKNYARVQHEPNQNDSVRSNKINNHVDKNAEARKLELSDEDVTGMRLS